MQQGTIKKLVSDKGFGFIAGADRGKDLFFHLSAIKEATFESLYEGQTVEYEVVANRGKTSAENLKV